MPDQSETEAKIFLQRHLQRGTVIVAGSGLSCAEGLPSMRELSDHLAAVDPAVAGIPISPEEWAVIKQAIQVEGVEKALRNRTLPEPITDFVRCQTAKLFIKSEIAVVKEIFEGRRQLKLVGLFAHLPEEGRAQIITMNYDRLIELAAEASGFKVDTKSFGLYHARFSKSVGAYAYCDSVERIGKTLRRIEKKVVSIYKPHGSLDWLAVNGVAIRSGFAIDPDRCLIITPGQNKYRAGYDQPFDMQRELANKAIDDAQRLLVIGYGFNDDHLETHLSEKIRGGTPTVIMTRTLSPNAHVLLPSNPNLMAIESAPSDPASTLMHFRGERLILSGQKIWDIEGLVTGVLGS